MSTANPSREAFIEHLRQNPPIRHARWPIYLARASRQGRHEARLPQFGEWLSRTYRDDFEAAYRHWRRLKGAAELPLPSRRSRAKPIA